MNKEEIKQEFFNNLGTGAKNYFLEIDNLIENFKPEETQWTVTFEDTPHKETEWVKEEVLPQNIFIVGNA